MFLLRAVLNILVRNASPRGPMCFRCLIFNLSGPCELLFLLCFIASFFLLFPVPILAASDLIQALTLIIATFGFYSDFFITFNRSNWRRIIRDAMDGTHPKVL